MIYYDRSSSIIYSSEETLIEDNDNINCVKRWF